MTTRRNKIKEREPNSDELEVAVVQSLQTAYERVISLGEEGREVTGETNEFGNVTFKSDIEAGRAVFNSLKQSKVSTLMSSEEHGKALRIGENPEFLGIIDELSQS